MNKRQVLQAGFALGGGLLMPNAQACEFVTQTMTIIHPWTRASAPGATTAKVVMTFQDVRHTDRLIGAETPVAGAAQMGGEVAGPGIDLLVSEGQALTLSETGLHLLLTDLQMPLQVGREYPLTLRFETAGDVQAKLSVDYARFY
jgi:copper(I)-binding protein